MKSLVPAIEPWYNYTKDSLPPMNEVLGVRHKISDRGGDGLVDEEAIWDGNLWTRKPDGAQFPLSYYYAWRKYEV